MTHHLRVNLHPTADAPPMRTHMGGTRGDIPCVDLVGDDAAYFVTVELLLGNHADPAAWLRQSAAALLDLADRVDARVTA